MMGNLEISVTSDSIKHFNLAFRIAFSDRPKDRMACAYKQTPEQGLIFFWTMAQGAMPLLVPLSAQAAADLAWKWLQSAPYPNPPDHDGDNAKGFKVYNEAWGHVGGMWQAFLAVKPEWIMYGK